MPALGCPTAARKVPRQKTLRQASSYGLCPPAASRVISKHLRNMAHFVLCHYDAATGGERKNQTVIPIKL